MPTTLCPLCNAAIPLPPEAAARRRVECPVCEGVFPYAPGRVASDPAPTAYDALPRTRPRLSPKFALALALGLGLLGVLAGLAMRGSRAVAPPAIAQERPRIQPWTKVLAAEWLPPGCEAVAVLQPAAWLESLGGAETPEARQALGELGINPAWLDQITRLTGLPLDKVDSVAVGGRVDRRALPPEGLVIVYGREPFELSPPGGGVRDAVSAKGRRVVTFAVENSRLNVFAHQFKDNAVAVAYSPEDLDGLPERPRPVADVLGPELAAAIGSRLAGDVPAWAAFKSERWAELLDPYAKLKLFPGAAGVVERLKEVRGGVIAVRQGQPTQLDLWLDLRDEATAKSWAARWKTFAEGSPSPVAVGQPGASAFARVGLDRPAVEWLLGRLR